MSRTPIGATTFPIALVQLASLPGLTGQSSTHGRRLLDRPVEPGDDNEMSVNQNDKRSIRGAL
jgi:hypothetical protein